MTGSKLNQFMVVTSAPTCVYDEPSLSPVDHQLTLWTHGALRCVLVTRFHPTQYTVQVIDDRRALCSERCADPEEAAVLAEHLWKLFAERSV
jgi:hypothetical protein